MSDLLTNVVGGLIVALIASWLGFGGKTTKIVVAYGQKRSKVWKWFKIVAVIAMVAGYYIFFSNYSKGGFQNPTVGLGFCLFFLGLILLGIGKFGAWFNRD